MAKVKPWTPDVYEEATAILNTLDQQIAEALHRLRPKLVKALLAQRSVRTARQRTLSK